MKLILEYFGQFIFAFVVMVGGLILLPRATMMPATSPSEMIGLTLALIVIGGGFAWFYLASSHQGTAGPTPGRV